MVPVWMFPSIIIIGTICVCSVCLCTLFALMRVCAYGVVHVSDKVQSYISIKYTFPFLLLTFVSSWLTIEEKEEKKV